MATNLIKTADVYYTLAQLRTLDDQWDKSNYPSFLELLVPSMIAGVTAIIGKSASEKHWKIVSSFLTAYITLTAFSFKYIESISHQQIKQAIKLLENNNELGAVRFRSKYYLDAQSEVSIETAVTYNSNY